MVELLTTPIGKSSDVVVLSTIFECTQEFAEGDLALPTYDEIHCARRIVCISLRREARIISTYNDSRGRM
jgi:hypothetical protein